MAEKRFTIIREVPQIYKDLTLYEVSDGTYTFLIYENAQELTDLLNELHEKNQVLQKHLDIMRSGALTDDKRIKELYDENEQLKKQLNAFKPIIFEDANGGSNRLYEKVEK